MTRKMQWGLAALALGSLAHPLFAQRMGYPPEEFVARRKALAERLGQGTAMLFGSTTPVPGVRFRQDNDFFYFTGNEDLNAVLILDAPSGEARLFLPTQGEAEIRSDGRNWLGQPEAAEKWGFASVEALSGLNEFLARRRGTPHGLSRGK